MNKTNLTMSAFFPSSKKGDCLREHIYAYFEGLAKTEPHHEFQQQRTLTMENAILRSLPAHCNPNRSKLCQRIDAFIKAALKAEKDERVGRTMKKIAA